MAHKQPTPPRRPNRRARRKLQLAARKVSRKAGLGSSPPVTEFENEGDNSSNNNGTSAGSRFILTTWYPGAEADDCECPICNAMEQLGIESDADGVATIPADKAAEFDELVAAFNNAA